MKHDLKLFIILPAIAVLSACASTPDPAEVCSAEWIAPRADKAVSKIEKRAGSSIKNLSKASESWVKGKTPNFVQMLALRNSLNKLKKELSNGQGIRDLRTVAKTCNDPDLIKSSMRDLIERQGVSDDLLKWMENNPLFESVMASILDPKPELSNR